PTPSWAGKETAKKTLARRRRGARRGKRRRRRRRDWESTARQRRGALPGGGALSSGDRPLRWPPSHRFIRLRRPLCPPRRSLIRRRRCLRRLTSFVSTLFGFL
uniref:Uncharacterized protein n=1 Tax=Oryza nivara TaxID=4536 RepID=A0A0E0GT36_ORYNI